MLPLFFGLALLILQFWVFQNPVNAAEVVYADTSVLSYASIGLFILACFLGLLSTPLYFTMLIFVVWAFPAPVNDLFPGTWLGGFNESTNAIFPFFTHIDIYLLVGVFKGVLINKRIRLRHSALFFLTVTCLFISIVVNTFDSAGAHESLLLLQGSFQFRYLMEFYLLLSLFDVKDFKKEILIGFAISIFFLLAESLAYSLKTHSEELNSGSLANNVFASSVSAVFMFLWLVRKRLKQTRLISLMLLFAMLAAVFMVLASGARMAILAFFVTVFIFGFIENGSKKRLMSTIKWLVSIVLILFIVLKFAHHLPRKYNPYTLTESVKVDKFNWDLTKFIQIERSWETNSLISRLQLYSTSLKMFRKHPICGIGVGRWNYAKFKYGFYERLLIDSHNGYLSIISQYGILGIPLILLIFVYPIVFLVKHHKEKEGLHYFYYLALMNLFFAFSDLSNSGIFKHQIFALLAFNTICLLHLNKNVSSPQQSQATSLE